MKTADETLESLRQENAGLRARVAELEYTAAKYEVLCAVTPDLILVIDQDGGYREIAATPGFPGELISRLLGRTVRDYFPAAVAEAMIASVREALATGQTQNLEYPVVNLSDTARHTARITPLSATTVLWYSQDVTAARQLEATERELRTFEAIVESSPDGVAIVGQDGAFAHANSAYRALAGGDAGLPAAIFAVHVDAHATVAAALRHAIWEGSWEGGLTMRGAGGVELPVQVAMVRLGAEGEQRLAILARDMRPFVEAERQRVVLQEQVIAAQRTALRELSTPLMPLADGVLALPLIGTLDAARAVEVMETLLTGIVRQRTHTAILDVTGIRSLDAQAADGLIGVARAAKLLGARVILTGVGPELAGILVDLDADLAGIVTRDTLQSGIADAMRGPVRGPARGRR